MRVVVNQLVALGKKTGIGHYTDQLLRCMQIMTAGDEIESFPSGWVLRACKSISRARPYFNESSTGLRRVQANQLSPLARGRSRALESLRQTSRSVLGQYFRSICTRRNYDLYHEPNGIPLPADCPTVTTMHDLSVLLYPQWHPADRVAYYEDHFRRSVRDSVHFLAVSEFSRQEVIRLLNIAPDRVTRTYNGIRAGLRPMPRAEVDAVLKKLDLPRHYLLYLGTIEPRKNVQMVLRAYVGLPAHLRSNWPLLLVGSWGWNTGEIASYLHREARQRGVIHLGYVKDRHLAALYNGARALVYPSWYEGFGLPPLEMMACGGAVLASTAGALVETVGPKAHLLPPDDEARWREAMIRVLQDDDWWQHLRKGVQAVAHPYTWQRCAAETLAVYRSLGGMPTAPPIKHRVAG